MEINVQITMSCDSGRYESMLANTWKGEIGEIPTALAAHTIGTDVVTFPDKLDGFLQPSKLIRC